MPQVLVGAEVGASSRFVGLLLNFPEKRKCVMKPHAKLRLEGITIAVYGTPAVCYVVVYQCHQY